MRINHFAIEEHDDYDDDDEYEHMKLCSIVYI